MNRILQTPKSVTGFAMSLLNSIILLLLFTTTSLGQSKLVNHITTDNTANAASILYNSGVDYPTDLIGSIDGKLAKFHDENDYIVIRLDQELKPGQQYTITWKYRNYTSGYPDSKLAKLQVFESENGHTFSLNTILQTENNNTLVHHTITATTKTRYLKLANGTQTPDFQVDAVSLSNSTSEPASPKVCNLQNFGADSGTTDERLIWFKINNVPASRYQIDESTAQFIEFNDGTAVLLGTASQIGEPCYKWTFSIKLINKRDWSAWSALGRSYQPNNEVISDHTSWNYYEMDNNGSTFIGLGCHTGDTIQIGHSPSNLEYGFQVGIGANLKNSNYGLSGRFDFDGQYTGYGEINGILDNCVEITDPKVSFNNRVFEDSNGNGLQDKDEPGIEGAQVILAGTDINGNGVNDTATTNIDGEYALITPMPGTYKIDFKQLPSGYFATAMNEGDNEEFDSDVLPSSGSIDISNYGFGEFNNIDAGYYQHASVGDLVWEDMNGDGLWSGFEPGIEGIIVTLKGATGAGYKIYKTTTSNSDGTYSFNGLTPGSYTISFDVDPEYQTTWLNVGSDDTVDNDVFPDLSTAHFGLFSGDVKSDIRAGFFMPVIIGTTIFDDMNNSCLRESGEPLVKDIAVELHRKNGTGSYELFESKNSQTDGTVLFENIPPGEYELHVDKSTMPENYVFAPNPNTGSDDNIDSDVNALGVISGIQKQSGDSDDLSFGIGILNQSILPVELVYFGVDVYTNRKALLEWTTASELDNSHFVIERSADGLNFEEIGVVDGQGNSNELNQYNYIDDKPYSGVTYYRLKQVDFNGDYEFSSIQAVSIEIDGFKETMLYPNPTMNETVLRVAEPFMQDSKIIVTNTIGQIVKTLDLAAGENSLYIDLSEFDAGIYFIQLENMGRKQLTKSVLKL